MATPAASAPRRSSYAAVVAAGGAGSFQDRQTRSGTARRLSDDMNHEESEAEHGEGAASFESRRSMSRRLMAEHAMPGRGRDTRDFSGSGGFSPSSAAFNCLFEGSGQSGHDDGLAGDFFTPTYLKGSTYIKRLREAQRAKAAVRKDITAHTGQTGSSKSIGVSVPHGKGASHRGITYDVVEKAPPHDNDTVPPLPTGWNPWDKHASLDVFSEGQQVWFATGKTIPHGDHEASAVRADHPMPKQCGIYYYEVFVSSENRGDTAIGIGFSSRTVVLSRFPGWEPESWAYHGDDGHSFCGQSSGKQYGPPFGPGDVVGCGVNFRTGSAFFTKNGTNLGTAFREVKGKLYPSIGLKKPIDHIRANFGQAPFVFDINGMMASEKQQIQRQIEATSFLQLVPPMHETGVIQAMSLQYLTQEGYIETARAFAEEIYSERVALTLDSKSTVLRPVVKEDADAGHRQRIRTAVLDGDIDLALNLINTYYPIVLKDNENVSFRLKCRKFVEMIRRGAELLATTNDAPPTISPTKLKKSNGLSHGVDWYDNVLNHDIDMDGQDNTAENDGMEVESDFNNQVEYQNLLHDTLAYGQLLQSEFKDDPRREVSRALEEAFSLMAYQDPLKVKDVAHLLDPRGRLSVAEDLNAAILHSLGKSSTTVLEKMIQQTTVLIDMLREKGGPGAFVDVDDFIQMQLSRGL